MDQGNRTEEKHPAGASAPSFRIPDHELLHCIGRGAYGEVWLARCVLGSLRAVKVVYRDRFTEERPYQREFEGIQNYEPVSRGHEGLVDILQVGRDDALGYFYCVMELADDAGQEETELLDRAKADGTGTPVPQVSTPARQGRRYVPHTLSREMVRRGRLPVADCIRIGIALAAALECLHRHRLAHRDIKPSNVIFVQGTPKLADIGLVAELEEQKSFVGTDGFVPPEGPGSPQADLYSLGKLLYEISTGKSRRLFPEPPTEVAASAHPEELLELNAVILRACRPDPRERYQSAVELGADLAYLASGRSVRKLRTLEGRLRRFKTGVLFGALAAAVLFGVYATWQRQQAEGVATALAVQSAKVAAQQRELALAGRESELKERLLFWRVDELFKTDRAGSAISHLAHLVRRNPSNEAGVARLLSALTCRSFALPSADPMEHSLAVSCVQFSPDGLRVATGSFDSTARIWAAHTGKPLTAPLLHQGRVRGVTFSLDGSRLATASEDGLARIWDVATGQPVATQLKHGAAVNKVQFSPDGRMLVTASDDGTACLWSVESGRRLARPLEHQGKVLTAEFDLQGVLVVTAGTDSVARIWEVRTGNSIGRPLEHLKEVVAAEFSVDGRKVLTASADGTAGVWDVETGAAIVPPFTHGSPVESAHFSPEGGRIVTASRDGSARVWDVNTGRAITPPMAHSEWVLSAEFSPEGLRIITASADQTARIWDALSGRPISESIRHEHRVKLAHFSPDGLSAVTGSEDGTAQVWNVQAGATLPRQWDQGAALASAIYDPGGGRVAIALAQHSAVVRDATTGALVAGPFVGLDGTASVRFSPNGERLGTVNGDHALRFWDIESGTMLSGPCRHSRAVVSMQFSPKGDRAVAASQDGIAQVWDVATGARVGPALMHADEIRSVAFSPDGAFVLTASLDRTARIWSVGTDQLAVPPLQHDAEVHCADYSSDGNRIATACNDKTARLWDAVSGRPMLAPMEHRHSVESVRFSPGGRWLLTVSADHAVWIWDALRGLLMAGPLQHTRQIRSAEFSPDGQRIVTSSDDGLACLWDPQTGRRLAEPFRHPGPVESARFSPDGRHVVTASRDGICRIWETFSPDLPAPGWLAELAESIVGERLDDRMMPRPVSVDRLRVIRRQTTEIAGENSMKRWASWFFGDVNQRPHSPFSEPEGESLEAAKVLEGCPDGLVQSAHALPTNATLLATVAELLFRGADSSSKYLGNESAAECLMDRARTLAPHDLGIWRSIANTWYLVGLQNPRRVNDGVTSTERALARTPDNINLWITKGFLLQWAGRIDEAREAYTHALELVRWGQEPPALLRRSMLFNRATLLERIGRVEEARLDYRTEWNIAPRDRTLPASLLDLSAFYNETLDGSWVGWFLGGGLRGLSAIPRGRQRILGVEFDIRGIVQLASGHRSMPVPDFPQKVEGIPVGMKARSLHFLHACRNGTDAGTHVGSYVIRYADGESQELPIVSDENIGVQNGAKYGARPPQHPVPAWVGGDYGNSAARLFLFSWTNPRPEIGVSSLDLISKSPYSSLFLVAVTAEP